MQNLKIMIESGRKTRSAKTHKKQEFTKKMYTFNVVFAVIITVVAVGLMIYSSFVSYIDLSPCGYIISPVWLEVGVYSAFMIRKSERENLQKYKENEPYNLVENINENGGNIRGGS